MAGICDVVTQGDYPVINLGGDFTASNSILTNIGARGTTINIPAPLNVGLWGEVIIEGRTNYGVFGTVKPVNTGIFNAGVYGYTPLPGGAFPPVVNYAVYGDLGPTVVPLPPCLFWPCPGNTGANAAGYFNGDIVTTTGIFVGSDASLKQNIQDLVNPMDIINQLQPKSYTFNQLANQSMLLAVGPHVGLLAQDVVNILPGLVKDCIHAARYDSLGNEIYAEIDYKTINYTELIPYLIAGMKQQQTQIDSLIEVIGNSEPPQQQQNPNDDGNSIDIKLSSRGIVLEQNKPNPYKENTVIEYFIPDDAVNVKIIFSDSKGNVLTEVEIPEKGKGQLNVYAADLSSGIYTYTIVANGITIDSKRMMKAK